MAWSSDTLDVSSSAFTASIRAASAMHSRYALPTVSTTRSRASSAVSFCALKVMLRRDVVLKRLQVHQVLRQVRAEVHHLERPDDRVQPGKLQSKRRQVDLLHLDRGRARDRRQQLLQLLQPLAVRLCSAEPCRITPRFWRSPRAMASSSVRSMTVPVLLPATSEPL